MKGSILGIVLLRAEVGLVPYARQDLGHPEHQETAQFQRQCPLSSPWAPPLSPVLCSQAIYLSPYDHKALVRTQGLFRTSVERVP